eukprot:3539976-Rhodomonas_salina.1
MAREQQQILITREQTIHQHIFLSLRDPPRHARSCERGHRAVKRNVDRNLDGVGGGEERRGRREGRGSGGRGEGGDRGRRRRGRVFRGAELFGEDLGAVGALELEELLGEDGDGADGV